MLRAWCPGSGDGPAAHQAKAPSGILGQQRSTLRLQQYNLPCCTPVCVLLRCPVEGLRSEAVPAHTKTHLQHVPRQVGLLLQCCKHLPVGCRGLGHLTHHTNTTQTTQQHVTPSMTSTRISTGPTAGCCHVHPVSDGQLQIATSHRAARCWPHWIDWTPAIARDPPRSCPALC